jgi:hypothetical protein
MLVYVEEEELRRIQTVDVNEHSAHVSTYTLKIY